jgi:hypothetical protein
MTCVAVDYQPESDESTEKTAPATTAAEEVRVVGGHLKPANIVERVVIVGQKKRPVSVTLFAPEMDPKGVPIEFEVNEREGHAIILKKPNFVIVNNWKIEIEY